MFRAANPADNFKTAFPVETEKFNAGRRRTRASATCRSKWAKKDVQGRRGRRSLPEVRPELRDLPLPRDSKCRRDADLPVAVGSRRQHADRLAQRREGAQRRQGEAGDRPAASCAEAEAGQEHAADEDVQRGRRVRVLRSRVGQRRRPAGAVVRRRVRRVGPRAGRTGVRREGRHARGRRLQRRRQARLPLRRRHRHAVRQHRTASSSTKADSGISYKTGKVGPRLCDFDGDGHLDLFVPQADGKCKLFRNDGNGKFADVTATSGDLAKPIPGAVSAAWGDFDNDGKPDLRRLLPARHATATSGTTATARSPTSRATSA